MLELEGAVVSVTGGTGFLGRHLVAELRMAGAKVHALGSQHYDLRQRSEIERMLSETEPDAVIHLAAVVGGIGANRSQPGRFFYENAIMGIELIEACRSAEVKKTVIAGTVCAYPKITPLPFREDDLWNGYPEDTNAPYGIAKKALLVQAQAYREQYGMRIIYLLPVNLYGPFDNFDPETSHVIPAMIRKFIEAKQADSPSVLLWGDGTPTREFIHVRDAARAFTLALERYEESDPVNIGSGEEISIQGLAQTIAKCVGYTGSIEWDTSKPNGQPRRKLSTDRALASFDFETKIDFDTGIQEAVSWYISSRS